MNDYEKLLIELVENTGLPYNQRFEPIIEYISEIKGENESLKGVNRGLKAQNEALKECIHIVKSVEKHDPQIICPKCGSWDAFMEDNGKIGCNDCGKQSRL